MSVCGSLHDETAACWEIEIYDDEFDVQKIITSHVIFYLIGIVLIAIGLNMYIK